jgi:hypothetical protein
MRASLLRAWLLWFAALLPLWLLYVGTFDRQVLLAGAAAAALSATLAAGMHRAGLFAYRLDVRVLVRELRVVGRVHLDFVRLLAALVHGGEARRGRFRWVDYPYPEADDARERANRAIVTTTSTLAPASYVIHIDGERRRMLLHELGKGT